MRPRSAQNSSGRGRSHSRREIIINRSRPSSVVSSSSTSSRYSSSLAPTPVNPYPPPPSTPPSPPPPPLMRQQKQQQQQQQQHTQSRPPPSAVNTASMRVSRVVNPMLSHRPISASSSPPDRTPVLAGNTASATGIGSTTTASLKQKTPRRFTPQVIGGVDNIQPMSSNMSSSQIFVGGTSSSEAAATTVKEVPVQMKQTHTPQPPHVPQQSRFVTASPPSLTSSILARRSDMESSNVKSGSSGEAKSSQEHGRGTGKLPRAVRGRRTDAHNMKLLRPNQNNQLHPHQTFQHQQQSVTPIIYPLPLHGMKHEFQQKPVVRFADTANANEGSELISQDDIFQAPLYQPPFITRQEKARAMSKGTDDIGLSSSRAKQGLVAHHPGIRLNKMRRASSDTCLLTRMNTEDVRRRLPSAHPYLAMMQLPFQTSLRSASYDVSTALDFAQRTLDIVNDGAICILISLGFKLGIFQAMAQLRGKHNTAEIIAAKARLYVRPVEEFLCAMACAGIVDLRTEDVSRTSIVRTTFALPAEHALWLTWGGGATGNLATGTNLALLCQTIPALGRVEHAVAVGYRNGTGVSPTAYFDYEQIQAHDILQTVGVRMLSVLKLVPPLIDELTNGACVLCIGGPADEVYVRLARFFPRSWFTCYSTDELRVEGMRKSTENLGVSNIHFKAVPHLEKVFERSSYDVALVLDSAPVRQCVNPVGCIQAVRRALRPGAPLIYVEMMASGDVFSDQSHTVAMFLYSVAAMYSLPRAIQHGSDGTAAGGIWGHINVRNAMYDASFADVQTFPLEDDSLNCVLVATAPGANDIANIQF